MSNNSPPVASSSKKRTRNRISDEPVYAALGMTHVLISPFVLPPTTTCSKCLAKKFAFEPPTFCCCDGEIRLSSNEFPKALSDLFSGNSELAVHFHTHARIYNNFFAFSSLGGRGIDSEMKKGIYVFLVQGQLYHFLPHLLPPDTSTNYLQMYFYDGAAESETRFTRFENLLPEIIVTLMTVMDGNPYAQFFRSLRNFPISAESRIRISHNPVLDQRVYNAPSSNEVAAILVDSSNSTQVHSPHIVVFGKSNNPHRVMHYYGCYDPLQYPPLFPKGDSGWHQGLSRDKKNTARPAENIIFPIISSLVEDEDALFSREAEAAQRRPPKDGKEISCREYYAYKFQIRVNNYLIKSGRLFQQYIVDMYIKIENTRLDFFRRNQAKIRSELYQGVLDSINEGHISAAAIGCRIVLPPSFIGGPRDVRKRYLNAMALVQKYGKPDLFITVTCNPKWKEIEDELEPGETTQDRPDLVSRVFNAKLKVLKSQIVDKKVFGPLAARVHVIEFQKRGLPHAHLLIILSPASKILSSDDFDKYVCAELPPLDQPILGKLVLKHMIHGPCGSLNPECPCMKSDGYRKRCKSEYPKKFAEFTTCGDDSYPIYRRRNNGDSFVVRRARLDNRWVIPYNPFLLSAFDCHINVEICSTIKAVKYLYKYLYKGHDRISFDVTSNVVSKEDEIQCYQSGRWVSPPEAAWRIFSFELYDISPPVIPLQIHLPNLQSITFRDHENLATMSSDQNRHKTMLTEFFVANNSEREEKYLYSEFPEHFVWNQRQKCWDQRQRGIAIGRVTYVNPIEGERYYLRLLLSHVRGPLSFTDLLTVDGCCYSSFREAAQNRGFLEEMGYARNCMDEAIQSQMPRTLRRLFATLLIFCAVEQPKELWSKYYTYLSEDFKSQYKTDAAKILQATAMEIEQYLEAMGKSLSSYDLDRYLHSETTVLRMSQDIRDALNSPIPKQYIRASKMLNREQRTAYKSIMHHIKGSKPGAFFIDGPGGTGKTFLYCALYAKLRSHGKIVLPTATSGIAASNIPTGRTAHSRFKISVDNTIACRCNVSKQSGLAQLLRQSSLLIWDEASMANKSNIEALDTMLQDICQSDALFGGKVIVFGGDFRQVLPVLPQKTQSEAVEASLVSSFLWPKLQKFKLTENMRAKDDPKFSEFLLLLGNGRKQSQEQGYVHLDSNLIKCINIEDDNTAVLIERIFPNIQNCMSNKDFFSKRAILTPKNEDVDSINESLIKHFPGTPTSYKSFDTVLDDEAFLYPTEFLNTLCPAGMSPHDLILKPNCPVILLRNLDPPNGLCNGT